MAVDLPYGFAEGPRFADDLNKIELERGAQDELLRALQSLLLHGNLEEVSHPLGADTDIRYVRSRDFPSLNMPPLYMTFRIENTWPNRTATHLHDGGRSGGLALGRFRLVFSALSGGGTLSAARTASSNGSSILRGFSFPLRRGSRSGCFAVM